MAKEPDALPKTTDAADSEAMILRPSGADLISRGPSTEIHQDLLLEANNRVQARLRSHARFREITRSFHEHVRDPQSVAEYIAIYISQNRPHLIQEIQKKFGSDLKFVPHKEIYDFVIDAFEKFIKAMTLDPMILPQGDQKKTPEGEFSELQSPQNLVIEFAHSSDRSEWRGATFKDAVINVSDKTAIDQFLTHLIANSFHVDDLLTRVDGKGVNVATQITERPEITTVLEQVAPDPAFREELKRSLVAVGLDVLVDGRSTHGLSEEMARRLIYSSLAEYLNKGTGVVLRNRTALEMVRDSVRLAIGKLSSGVRQLLRFSNKQKPELVLTDEKESGQQIQDVIALYKDAPEKGRREKIRAATGAVVFATATAVLFQRLQLAELIYAAIPAVFAAAGAFVVARSDVKEFDQPALRRQLASGGVHDGIDEVTRLLTQHELVISRAEIAAKQRGGEYDKELLTEAARLLVERIAVTANDVHAKLLLALANEAEPALAENLALVDTED